eukprot:gene2562-3524_t
MVKKSTLTRPLKSVKLMTCFSYLCISYIPILLIIAVPGIYLCTINERAISIQLYNEKINLWKNRVHDKFEKIQFEVEIEGRRNILNPSSTPDTIKDFPREGESITNYKALKYENLKVTYFQNKTYSASMKSNIKISMFTNTNPTRILLTTLQPFEFYNQFDYYDDDVLCQKKGGVPVGDGFCEYFWKLNGVCLTVDIETSKIFPSGTCTSSKFAEYILINPGVQQKFSSEGKFTLRETNDPFIWLSHTTEGVLTFGDINSMSSKVVGVLLIVTGLSWPVVLFIVMTVFILIAIIFIIIPLICCVIGLAQIFAVFF